MLPTIPGWLLIACVAGGLSARAEAPEVRSMDTGRPPPAAAAFPEGAPQDNALMTQAAAQPLGFGGRGAPTGETTEVTAAGDAVEPWPKLLARLLLHVVATVFGLRAGMKIFYENAMLAGFVGVVLVDALVVLAMGLLASATGGYSAMAGPQLIVSALVMVVTLHHFGFTKDHLTVILAVAVAKASGALAELGLRILFLDALLRFLAELGA